MGKVAQKGSRSEGGHLRRGVAGGSKTNCHLSIRLLPPDLALPGLAFREVVIDGGYNY